MKTAAAEKTQVIAASLADQEPAALVRLCASQQQQIDALSSQVKTLTELVKHLQHLKFGRSTETLTNLAQGELL